MKTKLTFSQKLSYSASLIKENIKNHFESKEPVIYQIFCFAVNVKYFWN